jgi:hypothetical protein
MTPLALTNIILADEPHIIQAISCGAAWEIWFQVEMVILLRNAQLQAARELPYPAPSNASLDLSAQDAAGVHAIEMKVESATNAGAAIVTAINIDVQKIQGYHLGNNQAPFARWVLGVGYSVAAKNAMAQRAALSAHNLYTASNTQNGIAVLVVVV